MSPAPHTRNGEWVLGRIGGAPVVVAPTSALLGLLVAASWFPLLSAVLEPYGLGVILLASAVTLVGVLLSIGVHELAHGMVGTLLGRRPVRYELYLWGGRTTFGPAQGWRPWKDVLTCLAGSAANLGLWAVGSAVVDQPVLPVWLAFGLWVVWPQPGPGHLQRPAGPAARRRIGPGGRDRADLGAGGPWAEGCGMVEPGGGWSRSSA